MTSPWNRSSFKSIINHVESGATSVTWSLAADCVRSHTGDIMNENLNVSVSKCYVILLHDVTLCEHVFSALRCKTKRALPSVRPHGVLFKSAASRGRRTRCRGQVRGQQSEEWEFLFWEGFHQWKQIFSSAPCKYFLCCLLSSVILAPLTCAHHPCHSNQSAQHVLCWTPATVREWYGGHHLLGCYLPPTPPHLSCQQFWALKRITTGLHCRIQPKPVWQLLVGGRGGSHLKRADSLLDGELAGASEASLSSHFPLDFFFFFFNSFLLEVFFFWAATKQNTSGLNLFACTLRWR